MTTTDISIPDLMDLIDRYADARAQYIRYGSQPGLAQKAWDLRSSIERLLTDEKTARRALENEMSS